MLKGVNWYRFLAIFPKQMQISTPNFQHPLSHQYHTLSENLKVQGIIGRPQMTSEWHNVPSISTPPRTQFLSYDQLTYMTCLRISSAIKLISRIFLNLENSKIQKLHCFFLFKNFSLEIKLSPKTGTQVEWQWLMKLNMFTNFHVHIIKLRTPAAPHTRRRILLSSTVPPGGELIWTLWTPFKLND